MLSATCESAPAAWLRLSLRKGNVSFINGKVYGEKICKNNEARPVSRGVCRLGGFGFGAALGRAAGPLLAQAACQAAAKVLAFCGFWITFARQLKKQVKHGRLFG